MAKNIGVLSAAIEATVLRELLKWAIFDDQPGTVEMIAKALRTRVMTTLRRHGVKAPTP